MISANFVLHRRAPHRRLLAITVPRPKPMSFGPAQDACGLCSWPMPFCLWPFVTPRVPIPCALYALWPRGHVACALCPCRSPQLKETATCVGAPGSLECHLCCRMLVLYTGVMVVIPTSGQNSHAMHMTPPHDMCHWHWLAPMCVLVTSMALVPWTPQHTCCTCTWRTGSRSTPICIPSPSLSS
jgi:hypothetical protein